MDFSEAVVQGCLIVGNTVQGISVLDKDRVNPVCSFLKLIEAFINGLNLIK